MKFRTGVIVGLAAGYVLGSRAGRERYEQIRRFAGDVASNEHVAQIVDKGRAAADVSAVKLRDAVGEGLKDASEAVRNRLET